MTQERKKWKAINKQEKTHKVIELKEEEDIYIYIYN
jgi:hypothetical protein